MASVSVVIPSRDRPDGLLRAIESVWATTAGHDVEIVVVLDEPDEDSQIAAAALDGVRVLVVGPEYLGRPQDKYQKGYEASKGDWIVTGADDIEFTNPGWIDACLKANRKGFVGLFDGIHPAWAYASLVMASREYIETVMRGRLGLPWYHVWWADMEWAERAKWVGAYVVCEDARFVHYHPSLSTADNDGIYQLAAQWRDEDHATYNRRIKLRFADE